MLDLFLIMLNIYKNTISKSCASNKKDINTVETKLLKISANLTIEILSTHFLALLTFKKTQTEKFARKPISPSLKSSTL